MAVSPLTNSSDLVNTVICINGSAINSSIQVLSILINSSVNYADKAEITILGIEQPKEFENILPVFNSNTLQFGNKISIQLGYGSNSNLIFEGVIMHQVISSNNQNVNGSLKLVCMSTTPIITAPEINATSSFSFPPPV